MKKILALLLALCMMISVLTGCGSKKTSDDADPVELTIFAAASMDGYLQEICDAYTEEHPNVTFVYTFDSSGTLKTQIEEGADCDIFISAGKTQVDQLDITADPSVNTDQLDFILSETRFNLLENKVALAVPDDNPGNINSYEDLVAGLKDGSVTLAMGNSDVPVGAYTQKILAYFELSEEDLASAGRITYGSNVREVTTFVAEATVDCGIIYQTDAAAYNLTVVDTATADMCGQIIYPAAVLNVSKNVAAAKDFVEFLKGDTASAFLEADGFTPLS